MNNAITFQSDETFSAYRQAQQYLTDNGYSYGPSCVMYPTAILKGDYNIAKWKNLTAKERKQVDGIITGDMRHGPVTITFYDGHVPQARQQLQTT